MKTIKNFLTILAAATVSLAVFNSCQKEDDGRTYKEVTIVNAYIDGIISSNVKVEENTTTITFAAGTPLENKKVKLVVVNGKAIDYTDNTIMDCRFPIEITLKHFDGHTKKHTLKFVSRPMLQDFFIEGVAINPDEIYFTNTKLIAKVPDGTDITKLKVTMSFLNGTLKNFENGVTLDFTSRIPFTIIGVDGTTEYNYELMISDKPIGPAAITNIKLNGVVAESITYPAADMEDNTTVTLIMPKIDNFSKARIELTLGEDNEFIDFTNGSELNLFNNPVIKVSGTNGVVTNFKFKAPMVQPNLISTLIGTSLGAAFSGDKIIATTGGLSGINVYNTLTGGDVAHEKSLSVGSLSYSYNFFRKIASDIDGKILVLQMSHDQKAFVVCKWNSVNDVNPEEYIKYEDLSVTNVRTASIRIKGKLADNAEIYVTMVGGGLNVIKYTVTGGTLNPTPTKLSAGVTFGTFGSVEPIAGASDKLITTLFSKPVALSSPSFSQVTKIEDSSTSSHTFSHKGRTYLAYVAINAQGSNKNTYKIFDITEGDNKAFDKIVFEYKMSSATAAGNGTSDAGFTVINDKLYVLFTAENAPISVFCLE